MSSAQETARVRAGARRGLSLFVFTLLAVEFLDELVFGVREAAWPLIRDDLRLSYTQVGVILSVPPIVGNIIEPIFGVLGDVWRRRALVLGGGIVFAAGTLLVGLAPAFGLLLAASVLSNPASGAFVGLSQATLMDAEPARREQNMARWALAGSIGNSAGPALVGACVWAGVSWRWGFLAAGALMLVAVAASWRQPFGTPAPTAADRRAGAALAEGLREALRALRRRRVVRWLVLLELGDFTYDLLRGFLALYFVDVVGAGEARAALAVAVWTWVGLVGDIAVVPLLERVRGLRYLRVSTSVVAVLFPALLLAEGYAAKLVLLGLLGLANAGWYAVLSAKLYEEFPGRSGMVMTVGNVYGLAGAFVPFALGAFAERYGLAPMMWILAAGPVALLAGLMMLKGEGGTAEGERTEDERDAV